MKFIFIAMILMNLGFAQNPNQERALKGYLGGGLSYGFPFGEGALYIQASGANRQASWLFLGLSYQSSLNNLSYYDSKEVETLLGISLIDLILDIPLSEKEWGGFIFPFRFGYGTISSYKSEKKGGEKADGFLHLQSGIESYFRLNKNWLLVPAIYGDFSVGIDHFDQKDVDFYSISPSFQLRWSP